MVSDLQSLGVVFNKSKILYNFNNVVKSTNLDHLIICEGFMDCIAYNRAGYANCVATMGTALTKEQIKSEFKNVVDLIFDTYKDFNITDYRCVLSLRDPEDKEKYHPDDEMWNKAENELREVLNELGIEYTEEIGEAAFYGPLKLNSLSYSSNRLGFVMNKFNNIFLILGLTFEIFCVIENLVFAYIKLMDE